MLFLTVKLVYLRGRHGKSPLPCLWLQYGQERKDESRQDSLQMQVLRLELGEEDRHLRQGPQNLPSVAFVPQTSIRHAGSRQDLQKEVRALLGYMAHAAQDRGAAKRHLR